MYTYGNYGTYNYTTTTTGAEAGGALALLGAYIGIVILVALVTYAVTVIGKWKMFTKAGEAGWKAIIPIYNEYVQCKLVGVSPWWLLIKYVGVLVCIIPVLGYAAYLLAVLYFTVLVAVSTANSFGKSTDETGFAFGLYICPIVFEMILGFGKAKYEGAKPMKDIIFKK